MDISSKGSSGVLLRLETNADFSFCPVTQSVSKVNEKEKTRGQRARSLAKLGRLPPPLPQGVFKNVKKIN